MKKGILIAVIGAVFLFLLHHILPSQLNGFRYLPEEESFDTWFFLHRDMSAFARRPLTTASVTFFHRLLPISRREAFIGLNFGLYALCGFLIFYIAKLRKYSDNAAMMSQLIFFTSFSIIFSFFAPIYSFDEPFQYVFLLVALVFIHFKRYAATAIFLFFALLARETTVLLFLPLYCFLIDKQVVDSLEDDDENKVQFAVVIDIVAASVFIVPSLAYAAYYYWFYGSFATDEGRFAAWIHNFGTIPLFIEAITSAFFVLALPILLISKELQPQKPSLTSLLLGLIGLNTGIVFMTTIAHEARLFALPLLLFYPMSGTLLLRFWHKIQVKLLVLARNSTDFYLFLLQTGLIFILSSLWAYIVYNPEDTGGCSRYYKLYFVVLSVLVFGSLALDSPLFVKKKSE